MSEFAEMLKHMLQLEEFSREGVHPEAIALLKAERCPYCGSKLIQDTHRRIYFCPNYDPKTIWRKCQFGQIDQELIWKIQGKIQVSNALKN